MEKGTLINKIKMIGGILLITHFNFNNIFNE